MKTMRRTWQAPVLASLVLTLVSGCSRKPDGAQPVLAGSELFRDCTACHGQQGEGSKQFRAPPIAGLPAWYVEAQLVKFQTGLRGYHPDDVDGLRMRPMSRQLMNRGEVTAVAAYIATLKAEKPAASLENAVAATGATSFATCMACHGDHGQGNEALKAPPLAGQADWYLVAQLTKFKAGLRGTAAGDTAGATMRPMSMTLADDQAIKNVVAHISTFNR
jgi:cytochrome c553